MPQNSETPSTNSLSKPYRRLLTTLVVLAVIAAGFVFWAVNSNYFAANLIQHLTKSFSNEPVSIIIGSVAGTFSSGLVVDSFVFDTENNFRFSGEDLTFSFSFSSILRSEIPACRIHIASASLKFDSFPTWAESLPDYRPLVGFFKIPAFVNVNYFEIDNLKVKPGTGRTEIFFDRFIVKDPCNKNKQEITASYNVQYGLRNAGKGAIKGYYNRNKIEGNFLSELFGQKIDSDFSIRLNRPVVSGHLNSAVIDLTILSRWLSPLWQDVFPFGFDGNIELAGSWRYEHNIGFLSNINGNLKKVRMVAMALFISIFEINASVRLFNGDLIFEDTNSLFVDFPARLEGSIRNIFSNRRDWQLRFVSEQLDMSKLVQNLPWSVRYGMAIPELSGQTRLEVLITGLKPEVRALLNTISELLVISHRVQRNVSGSIAFRLNDEFPGKWNFIFDVTSKDQLAPFFRRFNPDITSRVKKFSGPCVFSFETEGVMFNDFSMSGKVKHGESILIKTSGQWHEGVGTARAVTNPNGSEILSTHFGSNLQILDLILGN